jgi:hypothetical protein
MWSTYKVRFPYLKTEAETTSETLLFNYKSAMVKVKIKGEFFFGMMCEMLSLYPVASVTNSKLFKKQSKITVICRSSVAGLLDEKRTDVILVFNKRVLLTSNSLRLKFERALR